MNDRDAAFPDLSAWIERFQSDAGRQLLNLVESDENTSLNSAMEDAKLGKYDKAKKMLEEILSKPEAQRLIQELESGNE